MKKTCLFLNGLIILSLIAINILMACGYVNRGDFGIGSNLAVMTFLGISVYALRSGHNIKWFGNSLELGHPVNLIMSDIFSLAALVPAIIIVIGPLL